MSFCVHYNIAKYMSHSDLRLSELEHQLKLFRSELDLYT